jgi:hypothetical protein
MAAHLEDLLDRLSMAGGEPGPIPSSDGWELVLRENVAYLVDDATRDRCMAVLRDSVGLEPAEILAATDQQLAAVVAGPRPADRIERLRRCAARTSCCGDTVRPSVRAPPSCRDVRCAMSAPPRSVAAA